MYRIHFRKLEKLILVRKMKKMYIAEKFHKKSILIRNFKVSKIYNWALHDEGKVLALFYIFF